jgi:beta-1,4-N-acetylglucosaminyltransferase
MKIYVTIGTTPFDSLISTVDAQLSNQEFSVTCQITSVSPPPNNHTFVPFSSKNHPHWVADADVVITHGGAATVFELLEKGKKIVLVPNLDRIDKHQKDLAHYVQLHHYGEVCWQQEHLHSHLKTCIESSFNPYEKESFFMAKDILHYFKTEKNNEEMSQ